MKYDNVLDGGFLSLASGSGATIFEVADKLSGSVMDVLAGNGLQFTQSSGKMEFDLNGMPNRTVVAQGDLITIGANNDNYAAKKISFTNFEDEIFGNVSGDATIAAGGSLTIANDAISLAKLAGITRGSIIVGDLSGDPSLLAKGTTGQILQSDGSDPQYVSVSGDVVIASGGAATIQAGAVEHGMLNDNIITGQDELALNGMAAADELMIHDNDAGVVKRIGVDNFATDLLGLLTADNVDASADHIVFLDGGASGDAKVESIDHLATAMAGTGITAASGQFSTSVSQTGINSLRHDDLVIGKDSTNDIIDFSPADGFELKSNSVARVTVTDATTTVSNNLVVGGDLTVNGTVTTINSATIEVSSSFTFEGLQDAHETTLHAGGDGVGDAPKADSKVYLPALNAGNYFLPVLADKATQASAAVTAAEFAALDASAALAAGFATNAPVAADGFLHNDNGTLVHTRIDALIGASAGDGLTANGVQLDLDIAGISSELSTATIADTDEFALSDNGSLVKVDFQHVRDSIFADVSGDATIDAGGDINLGSGCISTRTAVGTLAGANSFLVNTSGGLRKATLSEVTTFIGNNASETVSTVTAATHTIVAESAGTLLVNHATGATITLDTPSDHQGKRIIIKKIGDGS